MRNSALTIRWIVHDVCNDGAWWGWTWRGVLRLPPADRQVGVPWNLSPSGIRFDDKKDCGRQGHNVENVNVVVSPFRPRMGDVQELKREICTVRWENSGGNEVLQQANTLSSVDPLSV